MTAKRTFTAAVGVALSVQVCSALPQEAPRRTLLPYIEAAGIPVDRDRPIWLSPTRVAFTAVKSPVTLAGGWRKEGGLTHRVHEEVSEVRILDLETRNTSRHTDGWLRSYESGTATIVLQEVLPEGYYQRGEAKGGYDIRLVGPLGKEERFKHSRENDFRVKDEECREDRLSAGPGAVHRRLKPEHGCLIHAQGGTGPWYGPWVYHRPNGQRLDLRVRPADVGSTRWIEWLGAYLLSDHVTMSRGLTGDTSQAISMMTPDGRTLTVQLGVWSLNNVRPTRAGMVATRYLPKLPRKYDGIYLWRPSEPVQIAERWVGPQEAEVSPDGCRIAYVSSWRDDTKSKRLRVVDVCQGFGLPSVQNPFQW